MKTYYKFQSKKKLPGGKPEFVKYDSTSIPFDDVRKFHLYYLRLKKHPDPEIMDYVNRNGLDSLEIVKVNKIPEEKPKGVTGSDTLIPGEPKKEKSSIEKRVLTKKEIQERIKIIEGPYITPKGNLLEAGLLGWYKEKFGENSDEYKKLFAQYNELKSGKKIIISTFTPSQLKPEEEVPPFIEDIIKGIGNGIRNAQQVFGGKMLGEVKPEKETKSKSIKKHKAN